MGKKDPTTGIRVAPYLELLQTKSGSAVAVNGHAVRRFRGLEPDDLQRILKAVEREGERDRVIRALSDDYHPEDIRALLSQVLIGDVVEADTTREPTPQPTRSVLVVGDGRLPQAIAAALVTRAAASVTITRRTHDGAVSAAFLAQAERVALVRGHRAASAAGRIPVASTTDTAVFELGEPDLVICAFDTVYLHTSIAIGESAAQAGIPILHVTPRGESIRVGPLHVPGASPCLRCACLQLDVKSMGGTHAQRAELVDYLLGFGVDELPADTIEAAATQAASVAIGFLQQGERLPFEVVEVNRTAQVRKHWVHCNPRCHTCTDSARTAQAADAPVAATGTLLAEIAHYSSVHERGATIRTIGVIGGGTAGYLMALACKRRCPDLDVTLIESPKVPIIGVGEATTPLIRRFLRGDIGLDENVLYQRVRPTWKLGIKFVWGLPGDYHYNYPFGTPLLHESLQFCGHINAASPQSVFMESGVTPVWTTRDGGYLERLDQFKVAYHLDNGQFVSHLHELAAARGVRRLQRLIHQVAPNDDGIGVSHLITDEGERLSFDVYVDCTGFRSMLMGKAMDSRFRSFAGSLFTDTAVVGQVPNDGTIKPYTTAETMDVGWCWNIPLHDRDSVGYVFSRDFCTPEAAEAEMRRRYSGLGDTRLVKFRVGRHEHFWRHNVIAIGNAYGFVEPLESTGLHMICRTVRDAVEQIARGVLPDPFEQSLLNQKVARQWDFLRWFLALHYKFNRRRDTSFWRACRADADVSGLTPIIDSYRANGPLGGRVSKAIVETGILGDDSIFGLNGIDTHLLGQHVPGPVGKPRFDRATWTLWYERILALSKKALPHAQALSMITETDRLVRSHHNHR